MRVEGVHFLSKRTRGHLDGAKAPLGEDSSFRGGKTGPIGRKKMGMSVIGGYTAYRSRMLLLNRDI